MDTINSGAMRRRIRVLGASLGIIMGVGSPMPVFGATLFDPPVRTVKVALKADPLNPQVKRQVSCFVYPNFVVKQVDFGEVGANRLAIILATSNKHLPCRQRKEASEFVIPGDVWSGYFIGVKSDYVFFDEADGFNGGVGFMVWRVSDKKKWFEDASQDGIRSIVVKDGVLELRYQRVLTSQCSVITGGVSCREKVVKESGVAGNSLASCPAGYQSEKEALAKGRCQAQSSKDAACIAKELKYLNEQPWDDTPTVIVYEAAAYLDGASSVVKPLGDALACRPSS